MNFSYKLSILSLALVGVCSLTAQAQISYTAGHGDIGVGFEEGELELHWHFENDEGDTRLDGQLLPSIDDGGMELEYEPEEVYVRAGDSALSPRDDDDALDVTGVGAGELLYILPQEEDDAEGLPFLGIGLEELDPADWDDANDLTLSLDAVSGPGEFTLWQVSGFDTTVVAASSDGLPDSTPVAAGLHQHFNWGFSEPGLYELTLTASGTPDGGSLLTDTATFLFAIGDGTQVPEPGSLALVGLGLGGLALVRRWTRKG